MPDHNEAMRLADELDKWARDYATTDYTDAMATKAAALIRKQAERIAELEAERDKWKSAEHALSNSYVRVRAAIGAICPPSLETAGLWAYVEATALALTTERDTLRAEVERLRVERDRWYTSFEHVSRILSGIHALMYPEPFTLSDGQTVVFRPKDPGPHEILQALSDRIRAIPDEVAAIDTARKATQ